MQTLLLFFLLYVSSFLFVVVYFSTCGLIVAGLVLGFSKHAMFWLLALVVAQSRYHIVSHFAKGRPSWCGHRRTGSVLPPGGNCVKPALLRLVNQPPPLREAAGGSS